MKSPAWQHRSSTSRRQRGPSRPPARRNRAISVEGSPCGGELGATPADQRPAADDTKETTLRQHIDRLIFVGLFRGFSIARDAPAIVHPDTVIRWHRAGFRAYWRRKLRVRGGRPTVPLEVRRLIRAMSLANPLWGAQRMHGELVKLGIDVGQTSVTKYMARRRRPPSQGWRTFLRNHADGIVAMDLFVVPTISFQFSLWLADPAPRAHPTAEWIARQLTEACGWDRDQHTCCGIETRSIYGQPFTRRLRTIGIRDQPTSPRSPWQNPYAEQVVRLDPTGMRRSYRGLRRAAPSSRVAVVHELLK